MVTQDVTNVAPTNPSFYPVQVLSPSSNAVNPSLVDVVHRVCGGSYTGFVADLAPPPPPPPGVVTAAGRTGASQSYCALEATPFDRG